MNIIASGTYIVNLSFLSASFDQHSRSRLTKELVNTHVTLCILLQDLGDGHFEIFLTDILPSLSKSVHS